MSGKMLLSRHADESKLKTKQLRFNNKIHPVIEIPFSFEIVQQLNNQLKVISADTY